MACSLARNLSFEEEGAQLLLLSARPPEAAADAAAAPAAAAPAAGPPPPSGRSGLVAELQHFVARLTDASYELSPGPDFMTLVQSEQRRLLGELAVERGWLASGAGAVSAEAPAPPAALAGAAVLARDPRLQDALKRVRQLDGALDAACTRAAAVAEKGRALEAALEAAEEQGEDAGMLHAPGGGDSGLANLEAAMRRERRRLLQADRLLAALGAQDGGLAALDAADAAGPSQEQERLAEALLSRAQGRAAEAPAPSPYDAVAAELAAIDARLAELGGQPQQPLASTDAVGQPAGEAEEGAATAAAAGAPAFSAGDDLWLHEVAAAKAGFLRAHEESRAAARRLQEIDLALHALRMGVASA